MLPQTKNSIKWIKALKSNKFKKGANILFNKDENSYCCLGVACKVNNYFLAFYFCNIRRF